MKNSVTQTTDSKTTWQNFERLMRYSKPYKHGLVVAIIAMFCFAAVDSFFISQLQPLIDEGLTGKDENFMKYAPIGVIILFGLRGGFNFLGSFTLAWVGNHVVADLRQHLFDHIVKMPVSYHDKESTGTLISKLTYDSEQVLKATSKALLTLVQQGAFVIGLLVVMFVNSWQLSGIFLLLIPFIAVIVSYVSKRFRKISKNIQNTMGEVNNIAEQTFNGHKVVLMFGGEKRESERFTGINKRNRQQRMKLVAAKSTSVSVIELIASLGFAFVLYFANLDAFKDAISPGAFTTVMTCMLALLKPIKQLTTVNADFQRGMAACESIFHVLDKDLERDTGSIQIEKAKGEFAFDDVTFTYQGEESPALTNLSFTAKPGQTIALVGRSGSGKSTASSLLLRFYEANQGRILIDGQEISDYKLSDLRKQFAYVSQNVVLFNDTLANNIAYGVPNATEEDIIQAAKNAYVWEFAKNMPQGIHTNIGDNGSLLSGGQRQRVAIARALLCDAPFLVLDEATSALDTESEKHIQTALANLQKNRTSVVIAHRLSTIENADNIIVMEQGQIAEQGSHGELIAKQGVYAQLHNLQFS